MSKGQEKAAEEALNLLDIDLSVLATFQMNSKDEKPKINMIDHLRNPANWKPFVSGVLLMAFFQATAYPIMIGNTLTLFKEATESIDENIASIIVGM